MDAERPQSVLVRADDSEVLPVAIDAEHVAELSRVDELLQLLHAWVVEQQMSGHEHQSARLCERDELLHLGDVHRRRLLDEDVLLRLERLLRERVVRRHRSRDHDSLQLVVCEHLLERRRHPRVRVAGAELGAARRVGLADPGEVRELVEVAHEVLAPVPEPRLTDVHRHSLKTVGDAVPFLPVALRRSTMRLASSTSCS